MSFNREHIIWQSKNGTWSIGFFRTAWVGSESDGHDSEWDVEYDYNAFEWVSTNHATPERARQSWRGANPGAGHGATSYSADTAEDAAQYDQWALWLLNPEALRQYNIAQKKIITKKHQSDLKVYFADRTLLGMRQHLSVMYDRNTDEDRIVQSSIAGFGKADGTWLTVDGKRIYNFATNRVAKGILKVDVIPARHRNWY